MRDHPEAGRQAGGQGLGGARELVQHRLHARAGEQGDRRASWAHAPLDRQRRPWRPGLVLGEAEAVLAGIAVGRPVHPARAAAAHVPHDQLQGTSDGRVGAVALAEDVDAGVHADTGGDGAVHDHDRARGPGGGEDAMDVELVGAGRLQRGQHDREVLGEAAGHDRVDGRLLHRALDEVRRHHGDLLAGIASGPAEHAEDAFRSRWDDRQAVRPAAGVGRLDGVLLAPQLDSS